MIEVIKVIKGDERDIKETKGHQRDSRNIMKANFQALESIG